MGIVSHRRLVEIDAGVYPGGRWSGQTVVFIKGGISGELSSRISRGLFKKSVIAYCLEKLAARFIVICSLC